MNTNTTYYFLGIGGIGMSALARYFKAKGCEVSGYDRTRTPLTEELKKEGISIHYTAQLPSLGGGGATTVIYTPAVPSDFEEFVYFKNNGFTLKKRAEVLGDITRNERGICIAGTHGKTTTSTITAHLLYQSHVGCSAFLGGIANNYGTNLLQNFSSFQNLESLEQDYVVIEADEYDRSFHQLAPYIAVITSADPDHLDIYGTPQAYREAFKVFAGLIVEGGTLVIKKGVEKTLCIGALHAMFLQKNVKIFTYSMTEPADFYAENIKIENGEIYFDFVISQRIGKSRSQKGLIGLPTYRLTNLKLGVPALINVENAVAAMAVAWLLGVTDEELQAGISSFSGVYRRFNVLYKDENRVLIDDYAHHPQELKMSILSIKTLYPNRHICGIFQPHLYTRTRDFAAEFAEALSLLDSLILLDIYPAREEPIEGVTSEIILKNVTIKDKILISKKELLPLLAERNDEVLITLGAGDIENEVPKIKEMLKTKN